MYDRIHLLDKTFKPYLSNAEIMESIDAVAAKINDDFRGCEDIPILLCVLNGSIMFTSELLKRLDFTLEVVSIKLSSYEGVHSTGIVHQVTGLTGDVKGRRVIVAEDIVDTGTTIHALKDLLYGKGATDVKICTMLLKPDIYKENDKLDYVAREIPNDFIVGFGLDYNQVGRNYKDIYVIDK